MYVSSLFQKYSFKQQLVSKLDVAQNVFSLFFGSVSTYLYLHIYLHLVIYWICLFCLMFMSILCLLFCPTPLYSLFHIFSLTLFIVFFFRFRNWVMQVHVIDILSCLRQGCVLIMHSRTWTHVLHLNKKKLFFHIRSTLRNHFTVCVWSNHLVFLYLRLLSYAINNSNRMWYNIIF